MSALANALDFLTDAVLTKSAAKDKRGKLLPLREGHQDGMRALLVITYGVVAPRSRAVARKTLEE